MTQKISIIIILVLSVFFSTAQNKGVELWSSNTFRFKINKDFKFDVENQLRSDISSMNLDQFFTQATIKYKFKDLRCSSGFRVIQEFNNKIEHHLRYHIDYGYSTFVNSFQYTFMLRIRFQTKNQLGVSKYDGDYSDNDLRYRAKIKFKLPSTKLKPSIGLEFFQHFETGALNGFNKYRIYLGAEYKLSKKGKVGLSIIREKQWVYWNPKTTWVFMPYYVTYIKKKAPKIEPFNPFD
jgi:hypothetical protein